MPKYRVGGQTVRRKNFYMPCIISDRFDDLSPEEKAKIYKATYWADNITNAEWPLVLSHQGEWTAPVKSRFIKKAAGWIMALSRLAWLNPGLYAQVVTKAKQMYVDQVEEEFPWGHLVRPLTGLTEPDEGEWTHFAVQYEKRPDGAEDMRKFTLWYDGEDFWMAYKGRLRQVDMAFTHSLPDDDEDD